MDRIVMQDFATAFAKLQSYILFYFYIWYERIKKYR